MLISRKLKKKVFEFQSPELNISNLYANKMWNLFLDVEKEKEKDQLLLFHVSYILKHFCQLKLMRTISWFSLYTH